MKNWADHCSSDEESLGDDVAVAEQFVEDSQPNPNDIIEETPMENEESGVDQDNTTNNPSKGPRTYVFPEQPPFSAFIGNLAYSIKEPEDLKKAVTNCVFDALGQQINILGARISYDRTGKHRGFGYMELETLDELKLLMQLNDSEAMIAGRKVQLDTANGRQNNNNNNRRNNQQQYQRRNHGGEVDGSNFRGGRYNNAKNNENRREEGGPPPQRTSLKLAPRSISLEGGDGNNSEQASNIFGGAKARDAQVWEDRTRPTTTDNSTATGGGGGGGRTREPKRHSSTTMGGRGRGGGGRETRGGPRHHNTTSSSNQNRSDPPAGGMGSPGGGSRDRKGGPQQDRRKSEKKLISPEERAAAAKAATEAAAAAAAPPQPVKPQPPTNKFAALMMDSDSE